MVCSRTCASLLPRVRGETPSPSLEPHAFHPYLLHAGGAHSGVVEPHQPGARGPAGLLPRLPAAPSGAGPWGLLCNGHQRPALHLTMAGLYMVDYASDKDGATGDLTCSQGQLQDLNRRLGQAAVVNASLRAGIGGSM